MAITKMMHMKASSKARIDIHLEHSINYILQPKKLGVANLAGGINCLPDLAYRQMKAMKQMFGKTGGRQGYHFVISLKPGEGTPQIMYDIAMRFAKEAFAGEYETVVAVHTDREHLHAHIVINSVNMVTGYKFQCRDGDWKYKFQPITNKLCEEYGLHITPAEYSKEPKNVSRPQWEREQVFSEWIKQEALFCAISAENMEHFIFLLEKLGFEVKQGKHIAVKVSGMKRFKRLDTISEDFSWENLETMFQYGSATEVRAVSHISSALPVRRAVFTPYQRKCYARMYRLHLADRKRFTYKSAYLYEQIRKMYELQEEYLVVVRYDVKSFADLVHLKFRLQRVDEELCKVQKGMYRDRALQKRRCRTAEDFALFEASEPEYREKLNRIKLEKKENHKKLKAVERCFKRDGTELDAELEYKIPVDDMVELTEVEKDEVPENPYREKRDVIQIRPAVESIAGEVTDIVGCEDMMENEQRSAVTVDSDISAEAVTIGYGVTDYEVKSGIAVSNLETYADDKFLTEKALVEDSGVVMSEFAESDLEGNYTDELVERAGLPQNKTDYMRMTVAEKAACYPFDTMGTAAAFDMVRNYFERIGMDTDFNSVYEEMKLLTDYYESNKSEELIREKAEQVIENIKLLGIKVDKMEEYSPSVLAEVFGFDSLDYSAGVKLFHRVLERLDVKMSHLEQYELFDRIYQEGMRENKMEGKERIRDSR